MPIAYLLLIIVLSRGVAKYSLHLVCSDVKRQHAADSDEYDDFDDSDYCDAENDDRPKPKRCNKQEIQKNSKLFLVHVDHPDV